MHPLDYWPAGLAFAELTGTRRLKAPNLVMKRSARGLMLATLLLSGCGGGSGGGGSDGSGTGTSTGQSQNPAPRLVQWNTFQTTQTNSDVDSSVQFTAPTKAGDTIWVAVTVSDIIRAYTITVTDTQGNHYTLLDQENDPAPGYQTVAHFYAANIVGDSDTPDTITAVWPADNYKGILAAEISGVTATPLVDNGNGHAGNDQVQLGKGTGNVTVGPINVPASSTPALLLALSMNTSGGSSDTGGTGFGAATAGTGLTTVPNATWNWGANLMTFATATVTSAESITATFNAPDTDNYVSVAAVFH